MEGRALAGASASSRFVSETQLTEAQKKREDDIRASYARIGKEVPEDVIKSIQEQQETYDPRSLYEKLQAQKDAKQEAWDEKHKLGNQFRGIDTEESLFLAEVARQRHDEQRRKERETQRELDEFRRAAGAARDASPPDPLRLSQGSTVAGSTPRAPVPSTPENGSLKPKAKRKREGLLGVVKKKAPSTATSTSERRSEAKKGDEIHAEAASRSGASPSVLGNDSIRDDVQEKRIKTTGTGT